MKISCSNAMVPGSSLTEQAKNLYKWGYDGIAIFVEYQEWNENLHQEILSLKEKTGIVPCEIAFADKIYGHLMDSDRSIRKEARNMYSLAVKVSGEIGAVTELEFAYGAQIPLPLFHPYKKMTIEEENDFLEMYQELMEPLVGTRGMLLLEGINRYESPYLNSIRECKDIVAKLNTSNTGVLADFFHMSIEEGNLVESILYAGNSIKHIHLGDNNRLLPGYGTIDWKACFEALKDINYQGFVNLECSTCGNPEETLPQTLKFLKEF